MPTSEIWSSSSQKKTEDIGTYGEHILLRCKTVNSMERISNPHRDLVWVLEFKYDKKERAVAFYKDELYGVVYLLQNDDDETYIVLAKNEYTPRRNDFIYNFYHDIPYRRPTIKNISDELKTAATVKLKEAMDGMRMLDLGKTS